MVAALEPKANELPSAPALAAVDFEMYRALLQGADRWEQLFLGLAFKMEVGPSGWTTQGHKRSDILAMMGYSESKANYKKLDATMEKYRALGVIDWYPPDSKWYNKFYFAYLAVQLEQPSQQNFIPRFADGKTDKKSLTKGKDTDKTSVKKRIDAALPPLTEPSMAAILLTKAQLIDEKTDKKSLTKPHQTPLILESESVADITDTDGPISSSDSGQLTRLAPTLSETPQAAHILARLLGVGKNAEKDLADVPPPDLQVIIRNAQAGHILELSRALKKYSSDYDFPVQKGVRNLPGYIVSVCKHYTGGPPQQHFLEILGKLPPAFFDCRAKTGDATYEPRRAALYERFEQSLNKQDVTGLGQAYCRVYETPLGELGKVEALLGEFLAKVQQVASGAA